MSLLCNIWTLGHNHHKGRMGGAAINHSLYLFAIGLHSLRPPCSVDISISSVTCNLHLAQLNGH